MLRCAAVAALGLLAGCTSSPPEDPQKLLADARTVNTKDGPRAALPIFSRALRAFRARSDRRGEAIALGNIGVCYKNLGEYQQALRFNRQSLMLKRALGDRQQEGRTLANLGQVYWKLADYPSALDHYRQALAIFETLKEPELQAAVVNGMSLVYDELGDYTQSRAGYRRALELYEQAGAADSPGASDALGNLGGIGLLLGRYDEAEAQYTKALSLSESLDDVQRIALDTGNLGFAALGRGDFTRALARFERALALARRAGLAHEEADWLKGRGQALLQLGQHEQAKTALEESLQVYTRAGLRRDLVEALLELGALHQELGDDAAASTAYQRAERVATEIRFARGVLTSLIGRGDVDASRLRFESAGNLYAVAASQARTAGDLAAITAATSRQALIAARSGDAAAAGFAQEAETAAHASGSPLLLADAALAAGEVWLARNDLTRALDAFRAAERQAAASGAVSATWRAAFGAGRTEERLGHAEAALTSYRQAVDLLEQVRARLTAQRERAGFLAGKHQVYQSLVRLLIRLGRTHDAFGYAEQLRGLAFRDLLLQGAVATAPIVDETNVLLAARVRRLQQALDDESRRPVGQQRRAALTTYGAELADAERQYQTTLDRLVASGGSKGRWLNPAMVDAAVVGRRLDAGTALIEYLVVEDALAVFVITRAAQHALLVPIATADLGARVDLLRDLLTRPADNAWVHPAAGLHGILIEPLVRAGWLDGIGRIYLVPHGALHYVPFAVLRDGAGRLMVDRFVVALLPAAAALLEAHPAVALQDLRVLAVAPSLAGLTYAREEAEAVGVLSTPRGVVLVGDQATETAVKREAPRFSLVHLATHGSLDRFSPLLSGLEFASDGVNDGHLRVFEVLGMRLSARLTVLSACETALAAGASSDEPPGEEFVGLTQAFLSAGSQAVLASLWSINDRATVDLMRTLYAVKQRQGVAETLAKVQRAHARERHPYYWAAFVVVGAVL